MPVEPLRRVLERRAPRGVARFEDGAVRLLGPVSGAENRRGTRQVTAT